MKQPFTVEGADRAGAGCSVLGRALALSGEVPMKNIFVGNLNFNVVNDDLRELFARYR